VLDKNTQWVVLTGCSSGIGLTTTKILIEEGFNVIATARQPDTIGLANHERLRTHQLDVTDEISIDEFIAWITRQELKIGALINNAGILRMGSTLTIPMEQIRQMFEINVFGSLQMIRKMLPLLQANRGRIINISSDSGLSTQPYTTIYSMSKYAIESLTEGLYYELKELKSNTVDICMIEPGNIATSIMEKALEQMTTTTEIPTELQTQIKQKLEQSTAAFKNSRSPEYISNRIVTLLLEEEVNLRYFAGTADETKYAIQSLLEQVHQINQSSAFGLSREELQKEFKFITNL